MTRQITELASLVQRHAELEGINKTFIPRLELHRFSRPTERIHAMIQPAVCFVVQGKKTMLVGEQWFHYDPSCYLVVSVDIPFSGQVIEASPEQPFLSLKLDIDLSVLSSILLDAGSDHFAPELTSAVFVSRHNDELLDALLRYARLLDRPKDQLVLAPLIEREILYWLLCGQQGSNLYRLIHGDNKTRQIHKVINHIKIYYKEHLDIRGLLDIANMSQASFFQHFKSVTHMTPLQYQKQLRLQEARRQMFLSHTDISSAGYDVGYDSPSQFSREYARLFGLPPSKDLAKIRTLNRVEQSFI